MINRIRAIRREKGLTLADVAARCMPATTAQTIGRLETGTRQLSLTWMNRIAVALEVEPELLVRGEAADHPMYVARLTAEGAEALTIPREAILPSALGGDGALQALMIEAPAGQYRAGDQVWLRRVESQDFGRLLNRDILAPRSAGRFAFGRMIDRDASRVAILPPDPGHRQIVVENPAWLAVAEMLVRPL
ncbi:MAG: helix-turn-helix transcriptional regulator [Proteobacteria bacterium]|nr:helix-turn-helix transcriptional regulator [Pseudomonadota bacterium]